METIDKQTMTMEEITKLYTSNYPFVPSAQRIGRFAKKIGYCRTKQMVQGKYITFYVKKELMGDI